MGTRSKLWYLTNINLFRSMTAEQMKFVQQRTVMREIRRKEVLYLPGEPGDRIYLLKRGVVKISALPEDGREVILALLRKGEVFGEEAVLDDAPRDHMAEAYDDALICIITRKDFLEILRTFPDLTFRVTKLIGFRLKTFRNRIESLLFKGTAARLAQTLLDLGRDHGVRDDHGVLLPLRLSQTDLANLIGVTRESVNLTLTGFRKEELVELEGRTIRLLKPEALAGVAQGA
jgi:CRP/FNR family cyclic AMP-dependent transcriptional regulator